MDNQNKLAFLIDQSNLKLMCLPAQLTHSDLLVFNSGQASFQQIKNAYSIIQSNFAKPNTKLEKQAKNYMAVRLVLLKLLLQNQIDVNINFENYNQTGDADLIKNSKFILSKNGQNKPFLNHSDFHISLSHSHHYLAVLVSKTNCGVDIQVYDKRLLEISKRVFSESEILWANNQINRLTGLWAAKEAGYKWAGQAGLHFQTDIAIEITASIPNNTCQSDQTFLSAKMNIPKLGLYGNLKIALCADFAIATICT